MASLLEKIVDRKREEVAGRKIQVPLRQLEAAARNHSRPVLDFSAALRQGALPNIIGELKRASPSKGVLAPDLDIAAAASVYQAAGVCAISVLTDRNFRGELADLRLVRSQVRLPLLRKDFIIDRYQIYEAREAGADAVLLIAAILEPDLCGEFLRLVYELGMSALVEVHSRRELESLDFSLVSVLGINNRNLHDFTVSLETTRQLAPLVPPEVTLVSESGFLTAADVAFAGSCGVHAVLIGEGIVTAPDMGVQIRRLKGSVDESN